MIKGVILIQSFYSSQGSNHRPSPGPWITKTASGGKLPIEMSRIHSRAQSEAVTLWNVCTCITARPGEKEGESYYFDAIHEVCYLYFFMPPLRVGTPEELLGSLTFIPTVPKMKLGQEAGFTVPSNTHGADLAWPARKNPKCIIPPTACQTHHKACCLHEIPLSCHIVPIKSAVCHRLLWNRNKEKLWIYLLQLL